MHYGESYRLAYIRGPEASLLRLPSSAADACASSDGRRDPSAEALSGFHGAVNNRLKLLVQREQDFALVIVQLVEREIELPNRRFVEGWVEPVGAADADFIDVRLVQLLHLIELGQTCHQLRVHQAQSPRCGGGLPGRATKDRKVRPRRSTRRTRGEEQTAGRRRGRAGAVAALQIFRQTSGLEVGNPFLLKGERGLDLRQVVRELVIDRAEHTLDQLLVLIALAYPGHPESQSDAQRDEHPFYHPVFERRTALRDVRMRFHGGNIVFALSGLRSEFGCELRDRRDGLHGLRALFGLPSPPHDTVADDCVVRGPAAERGAR